MTRTVSNVERSDGRPPTFVDRSGLGFHPTPPGADRAEGIEAMAASLPAQALRLATSPRVLVATACNAALSNGDLAKVADERFGGFVAVGERAGDRILVVIRDAGCLGHELIHAAQRLAPEAQRSAVVALVDDGARIRAAARAAPAGDHGDVAWLDRAYGADPAAAHARNLERVSGRGMMLAADGTATIGAAMGLSRRETGAALLAHAAWSAGWRDVDDRIGRECVAYRHERDLRGVTGLLDSAADAGVVAIPNGLEPAVRALTSRLPRDGGAVALHVTREDLLEVIACGGERPPYASALAAVAGAVRQPRWEGRSRDSGHTLKGLEGVKALFDGWGATRTPRRLWFDAEVLAARLGSGVLKPVVVERLADGASTRRMRSASTRGRTASRARGPSDARDDRSETPGA